MLEQIAEIERLEAHSTTSKRSAAESGRLALLLQQKDARLFAESAVRMQLQEKLRTATCHANSSPSVQTDTCRLIDVHRCVCSCRRSCEH